MLRQCEANVTKKLPKLWAYNKTSKWELFSTFFNFNTNFSSVQIFSQPNKVLKAVVLPHQ